MFMQELEILHHMTKMKKKGCKLQINMKMKVMMVMNRRPKRFGNVVVDIFLLCNSRIGKHSKISQTNNYSTLNFMHDENRTMEDNFLRGFVRYQTYRP